MRNSKSAPWHGEARKSALGSAFRKRNLERFKTIKGINERREQRARLSERSGRFDEDDNDPFYRS